MIKQQLICIGRIKSAHGVRGDVKIHSFTEDPAALADYSPLWDQEGKREFSLKIKSLNGDVIIASIEGIHSREAADALRGVELCTQRDTLPDDAGEDEFYYADLIGLKAELADGSLYGMVTSVQNYGAGDILEIRRTGSQKLELLPFTKEIVPEVHLKEGRIILCPPDVEFVAG